MSGRDHIGKIPDDILKAALENGMGVFRAYMRVKYGIKEGDTPRPVGIDKKDYALILVLSKALVVFWLAGQNLISMDRNALPPEEIKAIEDEIQKQIVGMGNHLEAITGVQPHDLNTAEERLRNHAIVCLKCKELMPVDGEISRPTLGQMVKTCSIAEKIYSQHHNLGG